jgi:transposase
VLTSLLDQAASKAEYQRLLCVWLRAALALPAAEIATVLGWSKPHTGRFGTTSWSSGHQVHRVSPAGSARLAQTRAPSHAPGYQPSRARGVQKKLRRVVRAEAARQAERGVALRLMFEDEARFGRMVDPRRAWAPPGVRPLVTTRIEREYGYA